MKSGSLNLLKPSGLVQVCNGIALWTWQYVTSRYCGKSQLALFPTTQYFDVHATLCRTADVLGRPFDTGLLQSAWPLYSFFPRKPKISHICSRPWRLPAETMTLSDMGLDLDYGILGLATVWSGTCPPTFRKTYCLHLHGTYLIGCASISVPKYSSHLTSFRRKTPLPSSRRIEIAYLSETSLPYYQSTWCHKPQDYNSIHYVHTKYKGNIRACGEWRVFNYVWRKDRVYPGSGHDGPKGE